MEGDRVLHRLRMWSAWVVDADGWAHLLGQPDVHLAPVNRDDQRAEHLASQGPPHTVVERRGEPGAEELSGASPGTQTKHTTLVVLYELVS